MITTMTKEEYLEGLGMPAPTFTHQFIINRINNNFVKRFPKSSYNFNCGMGICDNPEIIPDICLWEFVDKDNFETPPQNPLLEIEITIQNRMTNTLRILLKTLLNLFQVYKKHFCIIIQIKFGIDIKKSMVRSSKKQKKTILPS